MSKLNGYKTYVVFTAYFIVALLAGQSIVPTPDQVSTIDGSVNAINLLLANPLVVTAIGFLMRYVTAHTTGAE